MLVGRGQYTREIGKISNKKSEAGTDDAYISTGFWFKSLGFLSNIVKVRRGEIKFSSSLHDYYYSQNSERDVSPPGPNKKRTRLIKESPASEKENKVLDAAAKALKSITKQKDSDLSARDDIFNS